MSSRGCLRILRDAIGEAGVRDERDLTAEQFAEVVARQRRAVTDTGIDDDLGTAVTIQAMVFGNLDARSATGVAFTRDPATGERVPYGDYLVGAQGEDVVAGTLHPEALSGLAVDFPQAHAQLLRNLDELERHYRDLCDIEFTIEADRLRMLQTRVGKRSAAAALRIATELVDEGLTGLRGRSSAPGRDVARSKCDGAREESRS